LYFKDAKVRGTACFTDRVRYQRARFRLNGLIFFGRRDCKDESLVFPCLTDFSRRANLTET
jgi:hypothetical protein